MTAVRLISLLLVLTIAVPSSLLAAASPPDQRLGIAEGFRNEDAMANIGAGFERVVVAWPQIQPGGADDFSGLGQSLPLDHIQPDINRGVRVVGLLEFTPGWAAADLDQGQRSPPRNLDLPFDDPSNYFGQYVYRTVKFYAGHIDSWVIWNEPDFHPDDAGAGGSTTWLGSDEQFAQLLKVGYLAAKRANPDALVSFPGTSFFVDRNAGRPQLYDRVLDILARDPSALEHNWYHDVVSLNLYRNPDSVYRVYQEIKDIERAHGLDRPLWLTETNAMPSNDSQISCPHADDAIPTTLDQQADFAPQAFALGAAAGYSAMEVYQMVDADACAQPAVWGVTRDDGSRRPIADTLRNTIALLSGYTRATFAPLDRDQQAWPTWPDDSTADLPNWQVYQVAFDKPGNQRVTVLWNGDGAPLRARIHKTGAHASLVDRNGGSQALQEKDGWWVVDLPAATAHYPADPGGYYFIGGDPYFVVEDGVDPSAAVAPPALGDPGTQPPDFSLFVNPDGGQTVNAGEPADFQVRVRAREGFSEPVRFALTSWHSQRDLTPRDAASLPLGIVLPPPTPPGQTATIHVETAGAGPGIYYLEIQGQAGSDDTGPSHQTELALAVN
jgi:hypothetical protein